ncbi:MAG: hypothetical protein SGCHY_003524 [Lobulomycetales sp.]
MDSHFVIVGTQDNPLYELETKRDASKENSRHLNQFIIHSALDIVDELMHSTSHTFLKVVDRFNEWYVSAFASPSGVRFLLLHDTTLQDNIRSFFTEVGELYIKCLLNPFYSINSPINSPVFDARVRQLAKKYL